MVSLLAYYHFSIQRASKSSDLQPMCVEPARRYDRMAIKWLKRLIIPPNFVPHYGALEWTARDQHELNLGRFTVSPEELEKGTQATVEKHQRLREEASRLVEHDLRAIDSAQKLHANL